jgi:AcrR family transcriptional regulator
MAARHTKEEMLEAARTIVREEGLGKLTFDAVAERVGVTKQAVIYWFPSKAALLSSTALPDLDSVANVVIDAIADTRTAADTIEHFVRACIGYYLEHLDLFRLQYLKMQLDPDRADVPREDLQPIHRAVDKLYSAVQRKLIADPTFPRVLDSRRTVVNTHMACIGFVTLHGLTMAFNDPMVHGPDALLDSLVDMLRASVRGVPTPTARRADGRKPARKRTSR